MSIDVGIIDQLLHPSIGLLAAIRVINESGSVGSFTGLGHFDGFNGFGMLYTVDSAPDDANPTPGQAETYPIRVLQVVQWCKLPTLVGVELPVETWNKYDGYGMLTFSAMPPTKVAICVAPGYAVSLYILRVPITIPDSFDAGYTREGDTPAFPTSSGDSGAEHPDLIRIRETVAPLGTTEGRVFSGLTGTGEVDELAESIGVQVVVTTRPDYLGYAPGNPIHYFGLGSINLGRANGWLQRYMLRYDAEVFLPPAPQLFDRVGYSVGRGVEIEIKELLPVDLVGP